MPEYNIYGLKELADINREFSEHHAGTVVAEREAMRTSGCTQAPPCAG